MIKLLLTLGCLLYAILFNKLAGQTSLLCLLHQASFLSLSFLGFCWLISGNNRTIITYLFLGFALRLLAMSMFHSGSLASGGEGVFFDDDAAYFNIGLWIIDQWSLGSRYDLPQYAGSFATGYYYFNAIIMFLFGKSIVIIKLFNCFFNTLAAYNIYLMAKTIFRERIAQRAFLLASIFPGMIYWSCFNLKDNLQVFAITLALAAICRLLTRFRLADGFLLAISLFVIYGGRDYLFYLIIFLSVLAFIINNVRLKKIRMQEVFFSLFLAFILGWIPKFFGLGFMALPYMAWGLQNLLNTQQQLGIGTASYFSNFSVESIPSLLSILPQTFIHLLFAPLPWKADGIYIGTIPGTLFLALSYPLIVYGFYLTLKEDFNKGFLVCSVTLALLLIYSIALWGGSVRHRLQIEPLFMLFLAIGSTHWKETKILSSAYYFCLPLVYLFLLTGKAGILIFYLSLAILFLGCLWLKGLGRG